MTRRIISASLSVIMALNTVTLLLEGNFGINNVWNAKLLSSENRSCEVANQLWTTPIKAGESACCGSKD